jgi:hypothetical protein
MGSLIRRCGQHDATLGAQEAPEVVWQPLGRDQDAEVLSDSQQPAIE